MGEHRADADQAGERAVSAASGRGERRPPNVVRVTWAGDQRFDTGRPDGPVARLDGHGEAGQSPVDAVLSALAACSSVDVVEILAKRRTPVTALEIEVTGTRVESTPRRLTHVHLAFTITGRGIEQIHADRAVELAVTKYCSVRDSLDPRIVIEWSIEIREG